jgi:hypothetical protein
MQIYTFLPYVNLRFTHHSLNTSAMAKPHICNVLCSGTTGMSQDMVCKNNICLAKQRSYLGNFGCYCGVLLLRSYICAKYDAC